MPRVAAACLVLPLLCAGQARAEGAAEDCERAAAAAEIAHGVPAGLLHAIGVVESGRFDAALNRVAPWPWTTDVAGAGRLWPGKAEAVAAAQAARASGAWSVDAGCFQVNLASHPTAFASLDDAFDPDRNADYAARYLALLHERLGGWELAAGAYHSAAPALAEPYGKAVMSAWSGRPADEPAGAAPIGSGVRRLARAGGINVWGPPAEARRAGAEAHVVAVGLNVPRSFPRIVLPTRRAA